ncbi:hypothetical protein [Caproiciproducens faecalis]|uniref:Uncharacterized protein n=1 Tax=Caproiciproducens faecalis TaxID=2820301 RepID=A0ABS7DJQ5_9FIRM|nr:hypothetical protein [Caproiciproducens faecalis]MBW7571341.1 hypothetical protein [Caproiciproducens faecalis]
MSINGIATRYQNHATYSTPGAKNSSNTSTFDFQKEITKWESRIKETLDKEKENDRNGSIQMSEEKWRTIIKKVDSAIDTYQDNIKEQKQEDKKQLEEKIGAQKDITDHIIQSRVVN